MSFSKLLVANRGEIAVRVMRTARALGYRTVAVYSDADRDALHVRSADEAVGIGAAPASESYLRADKLIAAALQTGAQAIHPGYGFLSENAAFARAVQAAGLVFIGPDASAIAAMGDKSAAKLRMLEACVPCVPGYQGDEQSDAGLTARALAIGFPLMIKAAAGGGGRGMRLVHVADELPALLQSARSEAASAFGDDRLLLERALTDARHVEIQVFGDRHGNLIHLGERDCSIQRRHQKIVEEAPSPAVDADLRARMGAAAVAAARAVDYVGAGTVEFLLTPNGEFFFLEMNTRLQVEHAVTEMVCGLDLVEWQLRIARGEPLPMSQEEVSTRAHGCAIEVRLCTEDPDREFLPQTGTVLRWRPANGAGTRIDHGLIEGQCIGPHYDSLQAKLVAHGADRDEARRRLLALLDGTVLLGVRSNRELLIQILGSPAFVGGQFSTGFIAQHLGPRVRIDDDTYAALAAVLLHRLDAQALQRAAGLPAELIDWRAGPGSAQTIRLRVSGVDMEARIATPATGSFDVRIGERTLRLESVHVADGEMRFKLDGVSQVARFARAGHCLWLAWHARTECFEDRTFAAANVAGAKDDGHVLAPIDGRVIAIDVAAGAPVRKGERLLVLEAMKMQFQIAAASDGVVAEIASVVGQQVRARQLLARVVQTQGVET